MADESEGALPQGDKWPLQDYLDRVERSAINEALEKTRFNRTAAAKLLGITFRAMRYRMERLGHQVIRFPFAAARRTSITSRFGGADARSIRCVRSGHIEMRRVSPRT